MVMNRNRN